MISKGESSMGETLEADEQQALDSADPVLFVRDQPVMLAARVAAAFGVETREVNQAVRRNPLKFTDAHTFALSQQEVDLLTSQGVISKSGRGGSRALPQVFTQKGVVRLATVLTSPRALEATDLIIDLFIEVHRQLAQGRTQIAITNAARLLPSEKAAQRIGDFRNKLFDALEGLLGTIIDPKNNTTVGDELEEVSSGALAYLKDHLKTRGLENEKISAETLQILEKAREIRERTRADVKRSHAETERITLENFDKKIAIVEKLLKMADQMAPNAIVSLFAGFPTETSPPSRRQPPRLTRRDTEFSAD